MLFNPRMHRVGEFRMPLQCIWLKINGSWPLAKSQSLSPSPSPSQGNAQNGWLLASPSPSPSLEIFDTFYSLWSWYVICSVAITCSFQGAFLAANFGDIIMTTENCCTTFMGVLNLVRLIHLRLNQKSFRNLIQEFVQQIWISNDVDEQISIECRKRMKTFSIMTSLLACLILMYCVLPLVELCFIIGLDAEVKPFPYKMKFPFNPYKSWLRYAIIYLFTSFAGICVVTTLFAEDSMLGFFITHTCGQFRLLHKRIDALMATAEARAQHGTTDDLHREQILEQQSIARQHDRLIRFALHLEDFFNPILLVNVIISSVLICMVGFQLITGKNMFIGDYAKFIVYISSCLSQLYILCGNSDTLIQHSTETNWHLYNCNWEIGSNESNIKWRQYNEPPTNTEFRTNLRFMILCSQRPMKITAFKFSTLSLQSFTAILSTSMSYFTLLRSVYFDQD